jgi:hypothetical protein
MKPPDLVEIKLRDPEAIVLPRMTPVKKREMIICYHCDGKPIGETIFPHGRSPEPRRPHLHWRKMRNPTNYRSSANADRTAMEAADLCPPCHA